MKSRKIIILAHEKTKIEFSIDRKKNDLKVIQSFQLLI